VLERAFAESNRNRHADALRLGTEAGGLRMTPGVRLFLAEEHEYLGQEPGGESHFLDAEREATACIDEATAQPTLDRRERILRDCGNLRDRMNQRLVHVQVRVPTPAPPGAQVQLDGAPLAERDWGRTHARLPGQEIVVTATAPGRVPFRRAFRPMAAVSETVEVALPEVSRVVERQVVERSSSTPLRIAGGVALALGAVAGGVGVWQAVVTSNQYDLGSGASGTHSDPAAQAWFFYNNAVNTNRSLTSDQVCQRAAQDAATNPDAAQARSLCDAHGTAQTLAYAFGISGAVLAGVGVTLLVVSAVSRERPAAVAVAPVYLAGGGGVVLGGRF